MALFRYRGLPLAGVLLFAALVFALTSRFLNATAVPLDPKEVNSLNIQGITYLQKVRETGDPTYYGKAEAAFDAAFKLDSQNVNTLVGKGTLALARHQFAAGLELGQQAHDLDPSRVLVYGVVGDAQTELGQYDAALDTVQTMVDKRPDLSSYSRASYQRELHGDSEGAIGLMQQAVQSGGPNAENVQWVRVQLGNLYFNKNDLVAAEREYQHALVALPNYAYAQAGLAHVRAAQGRSDEAIALYTEAIQRIPLPEFVIALGETEQAAGQQAKANEQYGLLRVIEKLFQANGVNTDMELALFEADHGDAQQALTQARTAYAERPNYKAADTLAWALSQAGQQAEATKYVQEAMKIGTQDGLMFYHAGVIAARNGDKTTARARLEQALLVNPNFSPIYVPAARQMLTQIAAK